MDSSRAEYLRLDDADGICDLANIDNADGVESMGVRGVYCLDGAGGGGPESHSSALVLAVGVVLMMAVPRV